MSRQPETDAVCKAYDRVSHYFSLTLAMALEDAAKLRAEVSKQVQAMRSVLDVTPDGPLTPGQAQDVVKALEVACDALGGLVGQQQDANEATVAECRRIMEGV